MILSWSPGKVSFPSHPGDAFVGGVVEVAVGGKGEEFAAGVLDGGEGFCRGTGVAGHPGNAFIGRIIEAFVCDSYDLSVVWYKITERTADAARITRHPGNPSVRGVFYTVAGRVNPDQLVSECY